MPALSSATRYGRMDAPPTFSYATAGKRQMLPRPTAEPMAAKMNAVRAAKAPRSARGAAWAGDGDGALMGVASEGLRRGERRRGGRGTGGRARRSVRGSRDRARASEERAGSGGRPHIVHG